MNSFGEFRIAKANDNTMRLRRRNFFGRIFWSTRCRVGDDGCAIFLFVKKTRHSIQCPFSYLLRKLTTSEWSSFSYLQNPPVTDLDTSILLLQTTSTLAYFTYSLLQYFILISFRTSVIVGNYFGSLVTLTPRLHHHDG